MTGRTATRSMTDITNDNALREKMAGNLPSRSVSPDEHSANPGAGKSGVDPELQWARGHVPDEKPPGRPAKPVFRKTELLGTTPPVTRNELKKKRKRTLRNLQVPAGEIPLRQFETAFREFLCSLVERQDWIRDEFFLQISDLRQQIDALEHRLQTVRQAAPGSTDVTG